MRLRSVLAQSFSAALKRWPTLPVLILALVLGFAACSRITTQEYDLVIRGGRIHRVAVSFHAGHLNKTPTEGKAAMSEIEIQRENLYRQIRERLTYRRGIHAL